MTLPQIQETMLAAAPLADFLVMDFFRESKTWHIAADRETELFAELDETRGVLVVSTPLSRPHVMDQQQLELALRYGHLWDSSGGVRLSLEHSEGPFWLLMDVGAGLDAGQLAELLRNFVSKAAAWRSLIQQPLSGNVDDDLTVLSKAGILRV
jgi:hypothetical protein